MQKVYARDADGQERLLALVCTEDRTAYVCPIEKFDPSDAEASLEFAVGFPLKDVREAPRTPKS
jgi:hypothetical protein